MNSEEVAVEYKTEVVPLTLEIAKHYDRMATLKGDRDPDSNRGKQRVAWLHEVFHSGNFHSPEWSTVQVTEEKGKKYRVDGGNSSRMLTQLGVDFPEDMVVTIRHFRAPTKVSAIYLYEQFNQRGSTRTMADLIRNRKSASNKLNNISTTNVGNAIRGICCHLSLHNPGKKFDPLEYIWPEAAFVKWVDKFVGTNRLRKPAIVGAMFMTWNTDKGAADNFWSMVRDETGSAPEHPTRILASFVHDLALTGGKANGKKWTNHAIYTKCIFAWNAWRRRKTTNLAYHRGCSLPNAV